MKEKKIFSIFESRVLRIVSGIPKGVTMTYAEVAEKAGYPGRARAVGSILRRNHNPEVPCFRVVRSDGFPGGYNRGTTYKKELLSKEGSLDRRGRVRRYFSRGKWISRDVVVRILQSGGVGVLPTDTLYGLVCRALNPDSVDRVYRSRHRCPEKPCIILISDIREVGLFGIKIGKKYSRIVKSLWPDSISIIFPCAQEKFTYLHRGKEALAFRFPGDEDLLNILKQTGPLIAPSANMEGEAVAKTIFEAKNIFKNNVDFFVDGGCLRGKGSTLLAYEKGDIVLKREGKVPFSSISKKIRTMST